MRNYSIHIIQRNKKPSDYVLGLGIYADSDNSDSSSDENNATESCDSEAELQVCIIERPRCFAQFTYTHGSYTFFLICNLYEKTNVSGKGEGGGGEGEPEFVLPNVTSRKMFAGLGAENKC